MRVGLDARFASRGLGIGTVVKALSRELSRDPRLDLVWIGDPASAPDCIDNCVPPPGPHPFLDSPFGARWARRLDLDVMHFIGNTGWTRRGPVPTVLTVQDLIFLDTGIRGRSARQVLGHRYMRRNVVAAASAADVVCVASAFTRSELTRLDVSTRDEPWVIPYGVEPLASSPRSPGDTPSYVIAFAGRDPRKRTSLAVQGFRAAHVDGLQLVLLTGGGMPDGLDVDIAPDVATNRISCRGYLPRDELAGVLGGALALIYPSEQEGFGLPVLEAMSMGVPVITGLAPVTLEVGGNAIVPIDLRDPVADIARSLRRLAHEPAHVERLSSLGRSRAAEYSWSAAARSYAEAYFHARDCRS